MIVALARKLFGSSNEPRIKTYMPRVAQINALEKDLEKLSDDALRTRTEAFKKRVWWTVWRVALPPNVPHTRARPAPLCLRP